MLSTDSNHIDEIHHIHFHFALLLNNIEEPFPDQ